MQGLYAVMPSVCLPVFCLKYVHKNVVFPKSKLFRAMVSTDDKLGSPTWAFQRTHSWTLGIILSDSKLGPVTTENLPPCQQQTSPHAPQQTPVEHLCLPT